MGSDKKPQEHEAITTTIVGGRPPGCGQPIGAIPRGIEVLVKKAVVDTAFRQQLLGERSKAAAAIKLELDPAEVMMLENVPSEQLERIIDSTKVRPEHRMVFLGKVAAMMLAAVGMQTFGCNCEPTATKGIAPDRPPAEESMTITLGIQPDRPTEAPAPQGIRPDRPKAEPEPTPAPEPTSRGIRPDRPQRDG